MKIKFQKANFGDTDNPSIFILKQLFVWAVWLGN